MKLTKLLMIILALFLFTGAATIIVNAQNQKSDDKTTEKEKDDDDREDDDSPEAQRELAKQAKISLEEARRTALERVAGNILESELEKEKGRLVYEFEIRDKNGKVQEVLVAADTGEIISVEEESENDDDEETDPKSQAKTDKGKWFEFWRRIPGL